MSGPAVGIIRFARNNKLKFCDSLPPCAKHREGDRSLIKFKLKVSIFRVSMLIFFIFVKSERWRVVLSPLRFMWKNIIFVIIHIIFIIETKPNEQVNYPPPFRYSKQKQTVYLREIYYLLNFYILKNGQPVAI